MKFLALWLLLTAFVCAQDTIPRGTVLPAQLNSSLNSRKTPAGERITARVMQDVPLAGGKKIPAGAKLIGHVVRVQPASSVQPAEIAIRFESVKSGKRSIPVTTNLRAMASLMEVEDAQTPKTGPDRGTPWAWVTRNLVGGEVAYGYGGPVARGIDVMGEVVVDGVLARVAANPQAGCRGEADQDDRPQALWVFSSDACGLYGYPEMQIAHAGRTTPVGEIKLASPANFIIRRGSGILLRVNASATEK
jgi:hypothetical protein